MVTSESPILTDVSERFGCSVQEIWRAVLIRVAEGSEKGSDGRASFRRSARAYSPVLSFFSASETASRAAYARFGVVGVRFLSCRKVYASGGDIVDGAAVQVGKRTGVVWWTFFTGIPDSIFFDDRQSSTYVCKRVT